MCISTAGLFVVVVWCVEVCVLTVRGSQATGLLSIKITELLLWKGYEFECFLLVSIIIVPAVDLALPPVE